MVVFIKGKKYWHWQAVDADGYVLVALLQSRRIKKAALRLMRERLRSQGVTPRVIITDKLRSYSAPSNELMPGVEHRSHKGLNNRAENSHLAVRRRERDAVQVGSTMSALRFNPRSDRQLLQSPPKTTNNRRSPRIACPCHYDLARNHLVDPSMKAARSPPPRSPLS